MSPTRKPKVPVDPLSLATPRSIENLRPGQWWLAEYTDEETFQSMELWAEVRVILYSKNIRTGDRLCDVRGIATDGGPVQLVQRNGFGVQSLTAAQARRAGLMLPEVPA